MNSAGTARIIRANNMLQKRVGVGAIDPSILEEMQDYLDNVEVNFSELSLPFIEAIDSVITEVAASQYNRERFLEDLIKPIMQLKAAGGIFNHHVISTISGTILGFLENVRKLDNDMIDIIKSYTKSLMTLLKHDIRVMDDPRSAGVEQEIKQACMRYYQKYKDSLVK